MLTADMLLPCRNAACKMTWFAFDNKRQPKCPFCGTIYPEDVPILNLYSARSGQSFRPDHHRITVHDGIGLHVWHANRFKSPDERLLTDERRRLACFRKHEGLWHIVNENLPDMRDVSADTAVPIGKSRVLQDGVQILLERQSGGRLVQVQMTGAGAA